MIYDKDDMLIWEFHAYVYSRSFSHIKNHDRISYVNHNSVRFGLTNVGSLHFRNMYGITDKMLASLLNIADSDGSIPMDLNLVVNLDTGVILMLLADGGEAYDI